ncbi:hypothetical protein [Rhodococcus sp. OK302]|uniref:hypothetical protein n=1 Tax=Rhodococcus sp. OK302 TaxID=1882769 RepID=UPI000B9F2B0D|nr:hypothetical protein [Rhodococcus sp. OK302]OYD71630.1 hypothetical protein BDB13_5306 [Rhodococcus sp. OK302]
MTTYPKAFLRFDGQAVFMSDDRTWPTRARTTGYRPVQLALAATAVAGALAGGGLSLLSSPSTTAASSAVSTHTTKQSTASRLIVSSGFGTPDAVSNGS